MESKILIVCTVIITIILLVALIFYNLHQAHIGKVYAELASKIDNLKLYNSLNKKECVIPYPIYYINMDKDVNRREFMERQLRAITSDYHRVRGFNGFKITNNRAGTVDGISYTNFYDELSRSEIGCTISHLLAIKAGYQSGADIVLICEDDLVLDTCTLAPPISDIARGAPSDWELLQLVGSNNELETVYNELENFPHYEYVRRRYPGMRFWSMACYLINRSGMKKVLDVVESIPGIISIVPVHKTKNDTFPAYGQSDEYILDLTNTYSVLPCPFVVDNTNLASTIHDSHTIGHLKQSLIHLSKFAQLNGL